MSPVKSRVVPDGTATLERTMVAQEVLDLLAAEAPDDPEKVQDALENWSVSNGLSQTGLEIPKKFFWVARSHAYLSRMGRSLGSLPLSKIRSSSRSRRSSRRTNNKRSRSQQAKQGRKLNHNEG